MRPSSTDQDFLHVSGQTLVIIDTGRNAGTNNITISTAGAALIDGAATVVFTTDGQSLAIVSDGTDWHTF